MFDDIKEALLKFISSRLLVLGLLLIGLFVVLAQRLFSLQIVEGQSYQDNYTLTIVKERILESTRGNIYDRNGELLAYNELSYTVRIEDSGSYDTQSQKNKALNRELYDILLILDKNGDRIQNSFSIALNEDNTYSYTVEGKSLQRFLADVYGKSSASELGMNRKLGYDESKATPDQVMAYLSGKTRFDVSDVLYAPKDFYRIVCLRYAMSQNSYQKYILTDVASNVSDETVAYISEHKDELTGITVETNTIRKYVDSKYICHIIGYTGKIDSEEYAELSEKYEGYSLTDTVGKAGIEQYLDAELKGHKGYERLYVDNLGKVVKTIETKDPSAGNNVYLSIDINLQKAVYDLLEQEIAGIVYSKIQNIREYVAGEYSSASDIVIPIYDVYYALINNSVLDIEHFKTDVASPTEKKVYQAFSAKKAQVLDGLSAELLSPTPLPYEALDKEMQNYMSYVASLLAAEEILNTDLIDTTDPVYIAWRDSSISLQEYLKHAIEMNWIDITRFNVEEQYADSSEIYQNLIGWCLEELDNDRKFAKKVYKYVIDQDLISGYDLCLILYDQGVLSTSDPDYPMLTAQAMNSFDFLRKKIKNMEITPAQLALDPCTGSCVIVDPRNGELLASVSYPGYDTNKLANNVDADYFRSLNENLSNPQIDYATQQGTAPGSTFKMVTATAGLTEGVVSIDEQIEDKGVYENVADGPACWIWNSYHMTHGKINVSEALRDSCNYFFYELGYRMANGYINYNDARGIEKLTKYATEFGLNEKTGIEIPESMPKIATEYPITTAIGQSNNSFTTISLARYTAAVANRGKVYNLTLLNKMTDGEDRTIKTYSPTIRNEMTDISQDTWNAIQLGNRMVVEESEYFENFPIAVAGKTGTAQINRRPNHALFVCYAPYSENLHVNPRVAIATRIAYGYSSGNAAEVTARILKYYFGYSTEEEILDGQAEDVSTTNAVTD